MQLWLAYAFERKITADRARHGIERVERRYAAIAPHPLARQGWTDEEAGIVTWDMPGAPSRWPMWQETEELGVGTAYVPIGWRSLIGDTTPEASPLALAEVFRRNASAASALTPPFALGFYDRRNQQLCIFNDFLGYARIYEFRFPEGRVWSSQLGALPIFAGMAPKADKGGWEYFAASGWFMGNSTPIAGSSILPPGTAIRVERKSPASAFSVSQASSAAIADLTESRSGELALEHVSRDLQDAMRDAAMLWSEPAIVDLSGGRDSRLVAAAAVASGIDIVLRTQALYEGEVDTANRLVVALGKDVAHEVNQPVDASSKGSLRERSLSLHAIYDGSFAPAPLPLVKGLYPPDRAHMRGVGGEIAHGNYYPRNKDVPRRNGGLIDHLHGVLTGHEGASRKASKRVRRQIRRVLRTGRSTGLNGLNLLDYFYLAERLRRWSGGSVRAGLVSPLISPSFVRASFDMTPEERTTSRLHKELIGLIMPEWKEIPFYSATPTDQRSNRRPWLWETPDRLEFEAILASSDSWADVFDVRTIRRRWSRATRGRGTSRDEALFYRLVAKHYFSEHLSHLTSSAFAEAAAPTTIT